MQSRGSSLIEVIIAATVGILVVTALTFATIFSLRNANFAKNSSQATKLAQEGLESVRSIRDRDEEGKISYNTGSSTLTKFSDLWPIVFSCDISVNNCYFYFNPSDIFQGVNLFETPLPNFKRQFQIEDDADAPAQQKKVTAIVRWNDFAGLHESKLTTILRKL